MLDLRKKRKRGREKVSKRLNRFISFVDLQCTEWPVQRKLPNIQGGWSAIAFLYVLHFMMDMVFDVDTNSPRGIKNANFSGTFQYCCFTSMFFNGHTFLSHFLPNILLLQSSEVSYIVYWHNFCNTLSDWTLFIWKKIYKRQNLFAKHLLTCICSINTPRT